MTTRFKSTVSVDGKDLTLDVDLNDDAAWAYFEGQEDISEAPLNFAQDIYRPGMMWRDLEINGDIEASFSYIGDDGVLVSRISDFTKRTKTG